MNENATEQMIPPHKAGNAGTEWSGFSERVHAMLSSSEFQALRHSITDLSIMSLVGRTDQERWYSAFLAWLLNPYSNHGLNEFPLRCLLQAARLLASDRSLPAKTMPSLSDLMAASFTDVTTQPDVSSPDASRELTVTVNSEKCSFDVALTAKVACRNEYRKTYKKNLLLLIENKIKAKESRDQTVRYATWAFGPAVFPLGRKDGAGDEVKAGKINYRVLIFLTPGTSEGEPAEPKDDHFLAMTYMQLMQGVLDPCQKNPKLTERGRLLLEEFSKTVSDAELAFTKNSATGSETSGRTTEGRLSN